MAEVRLDRIIKRYHGNDQNTVQETSLTIRDKEFVVLVGPSGCGKSTLLRMIAGLEDITAGQLFIGDRLVNEVHAKDRDIAMVFQNYALYPHMTVAENIAFSLKLRKVPKAEMDRKVLEVARILDLEPLLDRKPKAMSGGQRQRVALGRAIVREPKVFLMDEPLSNLDAKLRGQMRAEILKLHQQIQNTVIYVTHDQIEAMTMGDRIVVLNGGYVQQADTPEAVYNHPANRFVAGFMGSPPMNFLPCRLEEEGQSYILRGQGHAEFSLPLPASKLTDDLTGMKGQEVIVGIRPEDLHDPQSPEGRELARCGIQAMVELVEPLGAEVYVHMNLHGSSAIGRLGPSAGAVAGQVFEVRADPQKLHVFHPVSDERISA